MTSPTRRSKVFIGAASEQDDRVNALKAVLEERPALEVHRWRDVFRGRGNQTIIEVLTATVSEFDFGVFLLSADDATILRGRSVSTTRGNVLLEAGMFIGALSRQRVFLLAPKSFDTSQPSDLGGVTLELWDDSHSNIHAGIATPGAEVAKLIESLGPRISTSPDTESLRQTSGAERLDNLLPMNEEMLISAAQAGVLKALISSSGSLGRAVVHASYGVGTIIEEGPRFSEDSSYVTVDFRSGGKATILTKNLFFHEWATR